MKDADTTLRREGPTSFRTTWSGLLQAADPSAPEHTKQMAAFCTHYWKPVYLYIRMAWKKPNEEAKDLTQEFFVKLVSQNTLLKYDPSRGRFRAFLKTVLKNFLSNRERDADRSLGDASKIVSLDAQDDEWSRLGTIADKGSAPPEEVFDKEWARTLLDEALLAVQAELAQEGKAKYYEVYSAFVGGQTDGHPLSYAELAGRFALQEHDVTNYISRTRERVTKALRRLAGDTVTSETELLDELRDLFSL